MANLLVPRMYGHGKYAVRHNLRRKKQIIRQIILHKIRPMTHSGSQ
jgi:hypothetical protein